MARWRKGTVEDNKGTAEDSKGTAEDSTATLGLEVKHHRHIRCRTRAGAQTACGVSSLHRTCLRHRPAFTSRTTRRKPQVV
jgi:hypothetical protein